jgi:hypothetical protein
MRRGSDVITLMRLLQDAETPLYSAYRFVADTIHPTMRLDEFLTLVNTSMSESQVVLRQVTEGKGREVDSIPEGLAQKYESVEGLDPRFDPFGYSLRLGPEAPDHDHPVWLIDVDLVAGLFTWEGDPRMEGETIDRVSRLHPGYTFSTVSREESGGRLRVKGQVSRSS